MNSTGKKTTPIAVIGFSDRASPLKPLWPSTHRALIPIAGKPLILHIIEQLAEAGIRHVRIAGSIQQYPVRNRLRDGCEWGMTIRYSDLHGDDLRAECLAATGQCLYLVGDELHHADLEALLADNGSLEPAPEEDSSQAGLWRALQGELRRYSLSAGRAESAYVNELRNVADYHAANLRAARGELAHLNVPGGAIHERAISDWKTDIAATAYVGADVFLGKHCRLGRLARLEEDCVLSNGVVVSKGARLCNVTVLPNCYVGSRLCVRDAVLGPQGLLALDGSYWPVADEHLLGATRDSRERMTGIPSPHFLARLQPLADVAP